MQTKKHSLFEAISNVAIGYLIALASQMVIFPQYGIHISLWQNIEIGLWFTAVSIARSYLLRRWWNGKTAHGDQGSRQCSRLIAGRRQINPPHPPAHITDPATIEIYPDEA